MGAKIVLRNIERRNFAKLFLELSVLWPVSFPASPISSTTLLKTRINAIIPKNRDREQTGRDIDRSDLLERIELPLITYTYDVHIKYGRKKKRKGERERKKKEKSTCPLAI